jgi:hypothetical protein
MAAAASLLTQTWPPAPGAYDYVFTLNDEEVAWEGLRRNTDYRLHYRFSAPHHSKARRLPSGQRIWRMPEPRPGSDRWGLCSFRRSWLDRARGPDPLVD